MSIFAKNIIIFGLAHALVDLASAFVVYSIFSQGLATEGIFFVFLFLYDFLAFAGQVVFGWLIDLWRLPKQAAVVGCFLVALAVSVKMWFAWPAVILAGIGNALFHLGGGAVSLNLTPGKALAPGLFVAPGAIGLAAGILAGRQANPISWLLFLLLVLCAGVIYFTAIPVINFEKKTAKKGRKIAFAAVVVIFVSIMIRALVASIAVYPWKKDAELFWVLVVAIALGKALGGMIADKFGWIRISAISLLISAVLIPYGLYLPIAGIIGMFLFQFVMAVALVELANLLPGRPGLVFGLNCLALFLGIMPLYFADVSLEVIAPNWQIISFGVTAAAASLLCTGIFMTNKILKLRSDI